MKVTFRKKKGVAGRKQRKPPTKSLLPDPLGGKEEDTVIVEDDGDKDWEDIEEDESLTVAKKKQIFKKDKAYQVRAQIAELKAQSKKFKKKDHAGKAEKKKIAKQIKELKAILRRSGQAASDEDSD